MALKRKTLFVGGLSFFLFSCIDPKSPLEDPMASSFRKSRIKNATPIFPHPNLPGDVVPIDIKRQTVEYVFDVQAQQIIAKSKSWFETLEGGYPYFSMQPPASNVKLNGRELEGKLTKLMDPTGMSEITVIPSRLSPGVYTLETQFVLRSNGWLKFTDGSLDALFFNNDFDAKKGYGFYNRYGPSNFQFDQFQLDLRIEVTGTETPARLVTNGKPRVMNSSSWRINFPKGFNTTGFYLHVYNTDYFSEKFSLRGRTHKVAVTVYSKSKGLLKQARTTFEESFRDLEHKLGTFPHESYTLLVHKEPWGVEYPGASISHTKRIYHEVAHSWIGRGFFPANGNAAWIDEALVTWLEAPSIASDIKEFPPTNLASRSPFAEMTPKESYEVGSSILRHLNHLDMSLMSHLQEFVSLASDLTITSEDFIRYLKRSYGMPMDPVICKGAYAIDESTCTPLNPDSG